MNTYQPMTLLRFTVQVKDERNNETFQDTIVLSKQQLQVVQLVGESSNEVIRRFYARAGYTVLDIVGKAERRTIPLDLDGLFGEAVEDE